MELQTTAETKKCTNLDLKFEKWEESYHCRVVMYKCILYLLSCPGVWPSQTKVNLPINGLTGVGSRDPTEAIVNTEADAHNSVYYTRCELRLSETMFKSCFKSIQNQRIKHEFNTRMKPRKNFNRVWS